MKSIRGELTGLTKEPNGRSKYDSLFEREYMRLLEKDAGVKEWTKDHGIKIPYKALGIFQRTYLPDFLVTFQNGKQEVHETKGAGFLFWNSTHRKIKAGQKWCKEHNMEYVFVENSNALFYDPRTLQSLDKERKEYDSLDEMLDGE